jgi:DNA polymerase III subunit delta
MKIYPDKLQAHLATHLMPLYLLSGDETLLLDEGKMQILSAGKQQGFIERKIYTPTTQSDWSSIFTDYQSFSLFSDKMIFDIRLTTNKLSDIAKESLITLSQQFSLDKLILLSMPKLDNAMIKTKWFNAFEAKIALIQYWPMTKQQLPAWIKQRLSTYRLSVSPNGLQLMLSATEGHLLATAQLIEKLHTQYGERFVQDDELIKILTENSHAELYGLLDNILARDTAQIYKTLINLQAQGTEPILVLWLLSRELRHYLLLLSAISQKRALEPLFKQLQIWPQKQGLYQKHCQKFHIYQLINLQKQALLIDKGLKGLNKINCWDELLRLSLSMTYHDFIEARNIL